MDDLRLGNLTLVTLEHLWSWTGGIVLVKSAIRSSSVFVVENVQPELDTALQEGLIGMYDRY